MARAGRNAMEEMLDGAAKDAEKLEYSPGFLKHMTTEWRAFWASPEGLMKIEGNQFVNSSTETPVTPEMIAAGVARYIGSEDGTSNGEWVASIYRAMHAVAPVELVSAGELAAARERDEARREFAEACAIITDQRAQHERYVAQSGPTYYDIGWDERRPVTQADWDRLWDAVVLRNEQLAARDARIAELDSRLALMAKETDADKKPAPATKEFPPRRVEAER